MRVHEKREAEACLNNILEMSPYLKQNTSHHYKDQLVNAV
jgi:hypothetical protein